MPKKPKPPAAADPNLAAMKAILEKKRKARAEAEGVEKPTDLTHKQPVRTKPYMRRRP